jgi:hypothetical protein
MQEQLTEFPSYIPSYGKIWSFGHNVASAVVGRRCIVEEKIDGSQLSCMVDGFGTLLVKSKGADIHLGAVPNLFVPSVNHLVAMHAQGRLPRGFVFRFEALCKPKHNTLTYGRAPKGNCVLLDVDQSPGGQKYACPDERAAWAETLQVDCVPVLADVVLTDHREVRIHLDRVSFLGGALMEGVVCKPVEPTYYQADGKRIIAKYVSEAFKETHRKNWEPDRAQKTDLLERIVECVSTPVRWEKAVQHMNEDGELQSSPADIGGLMRRVMNDVEIESVDEIKDMLWQAYRKEVVRLSARGVPQWYKERLLKSAFDPANDTACGPPEAA